MTTKTIGKSIFVAGLATAVATATSGYAKQDLERPPILDIYIFALKNGHAIFLRTPDDTRVLMDGGTGSEIIQAISEVMPFYSRRIDTVISTGFDDQNISGLIAVLERYSVSRVYIPAVDILDAHTGTSTSGIYDTFRDTLDKKILFPEKLSLGDTVSLGDRVRASVLFPASTDSFEYSKTSRPELTLRFTFGSTKILFAGNIGVKIQKFLMQRMVGSADIMVMNKIPSHINILYEFMDMVRPDFLVYPKDPVHDDVNTSKNVKSTLNKKQKPDPLLNVPIEGRLSLNEKGTIHLVSDGKKIWLK